eukprot:scaffold3944_cov111-Isochrysis_galbana.AAC.8
MAPAQPHRAPPCIPGFSGGSRPPGSRGRDENGGEDTSGIDQTVRASHGGAPPPETRDSRALWRVRREPCNGGQGGGKRDKGPDRAEPRSRLAPLPPWPRPASAAWPPPRAAGGLLVAPSSPPRVSRSPTCGQACDRRPTPPTAEGAAHSMRELRPCQMPAGARAALGCQLDHHRHRAAGLEVPLAVPALVA